MNRGQQTESAGDGKVEELRQYAIRLEATNLQLQRANQHKSRFMCSMSHELRTPISAVLGFSDLLKGQHYGPLNQKQESYVGFVEESANHLLSLITGLLDIAKIDAGRMVVRLGRFSWKALVFSVSSKMSDHIGRNKLSLQVDVDDVLARPAMGDEKLSNQILSNLLSNAVKFTPEGGQVKIRAAHEKGRVLVNVSDTGIGIPSDQREAIFNEFHRVEGPFAPQQAGAGIGLAITRRLVELLGGAIWVESEPGRGSTFSFTLPVQFLEELYGAAGRTEEQEGSQERAARRLPPAKYNKGDNRIFLDMSATKRHEAAQSPSS